MHAFNTPGHQTYVGRIPDVEYYEPQGMKDDKAKQAFERWHADQVSRGVELLVTNFLVLLVSTPCPIV